MKTAPLVLVTVVVSLIVLPLALFVILRHLLADVSLALRELLDGDQVGADRG